MTRDAARPAVAGPAPADRLQAPPGTATGAAKVVILGAGPPFRGAAPTATASAGGQRVLDWSLHALREAFGADITFVGGYRLEEVVARYPGLAFAVNPAWRETGPVASWLCASPLADRPCVISYADVVYQPEMAHAVAASQADVALAVDVDWRWRYEGRSEEDLARAEKVRLDAKRVRAIGKDLDPAAADGEFAGLLRLSPRAVQEALRLARTGVARTVPDLVQGLIDAGLATEAVPTHGAWAELNRPQDLAHFILGSKADTLQRLRPLVRRSRIGAQVSFQVDDWRARRPDILRRIRQEFSGRAVAVRSSSRLEDSWASSNAGRFETFLDIPSGDERRLGEAIDRVIASYGEATVRDQVLVQEMLGGVEAAGVVFTRHPSSGGPYLCIDYDRKGRTDAATSGREVQALVLHRDSTGQAEALEPGLGAVVDAVREIEGLVGHDALDVEFAVRGDVVHILQVRPIAIARPERILDDEAVRQALRQVATDVDAFGAASPFVLGDRTLWGIMPDWNPAEIVGVRPRLLAYTLYRQAIMDDVWATQRAEFGYRDVRPAPLMTAFAGHPYVDVRACLNSFIPARVEEGLARRLAQHYLDRLRAHPWLHDKVEFEVAFTCASFDYAARADRQLRPAGFSAADIAQLRAALADITAGALRRLPGDLERLAELERRLARVQHARRPPIDEAALLLDDLRRFGTLPFAHLARAAFVATTLLRSLESSGCLGPGAASRFLGSLQTVASRFEADGAAVAAGTLDWGTFVRRYGHLRPGTYELTSPRYDADPERFLRPAVRPAAARPHAPPWSARDRAAVAEALRREGLPDDVDAFVAFLRGAIEGREWSKFVFSRSLSRAMECLAEAAAEHGLSRERTSHVALQDLLALRWQAPAGIGEWLARRADDGERWHDLARSVELPPLLASGADVRAFRIPPSHPNFVTDQKVSGPVVVLEGAQPAGRLDGCIVLIPAADPGYDWLFGHRIAGLVTAFGGANSHMAVRAAELRLAAAIGIGQERFDQLRQARTMLLDAGGRRIEALP